jgi:glycosyltransferase involved in cell wall biosynthesis
MSKVSVVITTYKRPVLVIEAIKSCLNQTYLPYEILIGDDSPDNLTADAVANIDNNSPVLIRYIHNVPSLKQARNVNMLFKEAAGDKIVLLHDDDLLLPESLETLNNVFINYPSVSIAYGKQHIIFENGELDPNSSISFNEDFYRRAELEGSILTPFEAGMSQQIPNNGYMVKTEVAQKLLWRTDIGDGCEYDFGFRLGVAGYQTYFVNKFLGMYRLSAQSISGAGGSDMAYQSFKIMRDCHTETAMAQSIRSRRLYERAPIAITECALRGYRKEALSIYFSKWYRNRILSLRGIKRIAYILFFPIFNKVVK